MSRIELITNEIKDMGITPALAAQMAAVIVREDIGLEEKKSLLDTLAGQFGLRPRR